MSASEAAAAGAGGEASDTAAAVGADTVASMAVDGEFAAATVPLVPISAIEKPGPTSRALPLEGTAAGSGFAATADGADAGADTRAASGAFSGSGDRAGRIVCRNVDCKTGGSDDARPLGEAIADCAVDAVGAGVGFDGGAACGTGCRGWA